MTLVKLMLLVDDGDDDDELEAMAVHGSRPAGSMMIAD